MKDEDTDRLSDVEGVEIDDDPKYPTIRLSNEQKQRVVEKCIHHQDVWQEGWLYAAQEWLKTNWNLEDHFSLIDTGCDYFVTCFTNSNDHNHVFTQGP